MAVTIKLRRTSRDFNTLTNVIPAPGEPVFYGEAPQQTDEVYYPFVIGNLSGNAISNLPRAAFFTKNIPGNKFFRGGNENYPVFSTLTASDIPNLPTSRLTSGTLGVARGGTGISSLITGGVLYGQSSTQVAVTAAGIAGQVLMSNGTSAPYWSNITNLTVDKASKDGEGNVITSTYVKKTDVANKGNSTTPVYFDSDGKAVALNYTIAKSVPSNAVFTDTIYTGINGISVSGTSISNSGVRSVSTGGANGTVSVNTNGTLADVAVKGLGSSAYTNTDYFTHRLTFVDTGGPGAGNWYDGTQDQVISYNTIGAAPSVHTHTGSQISSIVSSRTQITSGFTVNSLFSSFVSLEVACTQKTKSLLDEWKSVAGWYNDGYRDLQNTLSGLSVYARSYAFRPLIEYDQTISDGIISLPEAYRAGIGGACIPVLFLPLESSGQSTVGSFVTGWLVFPDYADNSGIVWMGAIPQQFQEGNVFMIFSSGSYLLSRRQ